MYKDNEKEDQIERWKKLTKDQLTDIQRAEIRLHNAKKSVRTLKYKKRQQHKKKRDTALYTLGALFAYYLESTDPKKQAFAEKLWTEYYRPVSPGVLDDRRATALKEVFNLSASSDANVDNSGSKNARG